mmetsp:Transcript_2166/g.5499  ORF Transcript_2166/g.5499 Transcript_2166/m.5499 type:complete len:224 (+) Transcript_2166:114-785(+)
MPAASVVSSAAKSSLSRASAASSASDKVHPVAKLTRLDGSCSCGLSKSKCTCKRPVKNLYSREVFQALNHLGGATWTRRFGDISEEQGAEEVAEQLPSSRPPASLSLPVGQAAAAPQALLQTPCATARASLPSRLPEDVVVQHADLGGGVMPALAAAPAGNTSASATQVVVESTSRSEVQTGVFQTPVRQGGRQEELVEERTPSIVARELEPVGEVESYRDEN